MRQPLVALTLLYLGGIVTGDLFPFSPRPFLLAVLGCSLLCLCLSTLRRWLLLPLIFVTGATNLNLQTAIISPLDLRILAARDPEEVIVRGRLVATPEIRVQSGDDPLSFRTLAYLAVTGLSRGDGLWIPATGKVVVTTPELLPPSMSAGRSVVVSGVLSEPARAAAPGLFDYREYLRRQGISYQLKASSSHEWKAVSKSPVHPPWSDQFLDWAKPKLALGFPPEDPAIQLVWAMALGWKTALNGEVAEPFMRSGTMHVFAVSGLHISLISLILVALLRTVGTPRSWCGLAVLPAIWFYTAAIGWQASAVRSTVMMTIIIAGWSLRRPPDLLNSLSAAAMVLLLADPQQLFQAGFQLSFFVVLSLALFAPILQRLGEPFWERDPLLPERAVPWWQAKLRWTARKVVLSLATSLAAWLGSIPLAAHYFHYCTPVSLLANLLVVPISGLALMSAMGSLLVGAFAPWLSVLFNHSAWFWMKLMIWVSVWAADLPGAWFHVAGPSSSTFLLYYLLLILIMNGWLFQRRHRLAAWISLVLVAGAWGIHRWHERAVTELTVLPLSGGEAFYLEGAQARGRHLIDCGAERQTQVITSPYLRTRGVNHLDTFTLTHGQARNVGGAGLIMDLFKPRSVCTSPVSFRSSVYRDVQQRLRHETRVRTVQRGDFVGPWRVLHPASPGSASQADDAALVLEAEFAGTKLLLLSDLARRGQEAVYSYKTNLRADIVISGLPARSEPLVHSLLATLEPRVVIITDAEFPAAARASRALRQRLDQAGALVLYTRETGALLIRFGVSGWVIRTAAGDEYRSSAKASAPAPNEKVHR